jgi:hypothetical protein
MRNARQDVANSRFFFFSGSSGQRATFFDLKFENLGRGTSGGTDNPGAIVMFNGNAYRQYFTVMNCEIQNYAAPLVGSIYSTRYAVIEGNTLGNSSVSTVGQGIFAKANNDRWSIRRNVSTQANFEYGAIEFNLTSGAFNPQQAEISYNLVRTPSTTATVRAIVYNWGTSPLEGSTVWVYRNTIIGRLSAIKSAFTGIIENNFIFNDEGVDFNSFNATHTQGSGNVLGRSSSAFSFFDANYLLFGANRTTFRGFVGHEIVN